MSPRGLLVSVRSAPEALLAVRGGAAIVDVKEPDLGSLGMADPEVWRAVRAVVPASIPVSVALGELRDWRERDAPPPSAFEGLAFRKMGLAGAESGRSWVAEWASLRRSWGDGPPWIAVAYRDWERAGAPDPDWVIAEAERAGCVGVLIDTFEKRSAPSLDESWSKRMATIRDRVGLVAVAGGVDAETIARFGPFSPDLFAVRGSACEAGDRLGTIDPERVECLAIACERSRVVAGIA